METRPETTPRPGAGTEPVEDIAALDPVLSALGLAAHEVVARFVDRRFGKRYDAYRLTDARVLKADDGEHDVFERRLDARPDLPVPRRLATAEVAGRRWHVFTDVGSVDLQTLDRPQAVAAGEALGRLHAAFWSEGPPPEEVVTRLDERAPRFDACTGIAADLGPALRLLDERSRTAPWTLCQGDLLPMNVLWDGARATIIDFGVAGLRPYFGDPARFVVFGGPDGTYVQPAGCREAFHDAYLTVVRAGTGTSLTDDQVRRDIALGELYEITCCVSSAVRRRGATPDDEALQADLATARALARRLIRPA